MSDCGAASSSSSREGQGGGGTTSSRNRGGGGGGGGGSSTPDQQGGDPGGSYDQCNICLDGARDAVVSMCGHLFCWPCLHRWMETRPNGQTCPVCKAAISSEKVIPIYGRNNPNKTDPRENLPPRPPGRRTEPERQGFPGFGFNDGSFQMSFGIGAFPFGFFASSFNWNDGRPAPPPPGSPHHEEEQMLSKVFLILAILFTLWLLIA